MEEVRHWTYLGLIPNAFMMNDFHIHHSTQRPAFYLILVIRNPDSIFLYFSLTHFWKVLHCVSMSVRKDYRRHQPHGVCEWIIPSTFLLYSSQVPAVSDLLVMLSFHLYNPAVPTLSTFDLYSFYVVVHNYARDFNNYILCHFIMYIDCYNLLHENNFVVWFTFPGPFLRTVLVPI